MDAKEYKARGIAKTAQDVVIVGVPCVVYSYWYAGPESRKPRYRGWDVVRKDSGQAIDTLSPTRADAIRNANRNLLHFGTDYRS